MMAPTPVTPSSGKKPSQKSKGNNSYSSPKSKPKHSRSISLNREEEKGELVNSMFVRLTSFCDQRRQQQDGKKQVIMNAMDMKRLNNSKDDDCMLIFMISHNDLQMLDVCHAVSSIQQQRPQQRSSASKSYSKASSTSGNGIKEGEIVLLPTSLHKRFYNRLMNNPSNPTSHHQIIISPLKTSPLATTILTRICQPAKEVILKLVDNRQITIDALSSGQYRMLCTLTYAHLLRGSYSQQFLPYVHQNTTKDDTAYEFNVSFQGLIQSLHLVSSSYDRSNCNNNFENSCPTKKREEQNDQQVQQHQEHDENIKQFSAQLKNTLIISADKESQTTTPISSTQWLEQYIQILENSPTPPRVLLLRVTHDTTISFCPSDRCVEQPYSDSSDPRHCGVTTQPIIHHNDFIQNDVVGLESVLKELHSILTPALIHPELFQQSTSNTYISNFMRAPRGVLLYGPSGVGKSALASQYAREVRSQQNASHPVSVEYYPCISLISKSTVFGQAERTITSIFDRAELSAGKDGKSTLIILDDIQWICPRRESLSNVSSNSGSIAATFLALLDGIVPSSQRHGQQVDERDIENIGNVCILGIAVNPSTLDPALRRPGRLDREIEVPIPDDLARSQILRHQLANVLGSKSCASDLIHDQSTLQLAKLAKGFTGADTMIAVKEACRIALIRHEHMHHGSFSRPEECQPFQVTLDDVQRAISSATPSSIRHVAVQVPSVRWADIGGMHDVKRAIREAIELPTTHSELFSSLGIAAPRGVLLYGPPGTAKTMLAKAVATEVNMNFLAVKGPELLSKWLGESERTLATLFRRARQACPCVIFFDEIDAIGSKRGGGSDGVAVSGGERLLSQLLTELDGINSSKERRVVVVGATNRPDLLDPALTRPGRIDRMIYVGVPDQESRASIIQLGLANKQCDNDVDLDYLSSDEITGGYSGAELIAICRDAALFAIEEEEEAKSGKPMVAMRHMLKSVNGTRKQVTNDIIQFYERFRRL